MRSHRMRAACNRIADYNYKYLGGATNPTSGTSGFYTGLLYHTLPNHSNRQIVVCVISNGTGAASISGAALIATVNGTNTQAKWWLIEKPSGATSQISVSYAGNVDRCSVVVFEVLKRASKYSTSGHTAIGGSNDPQDLSLSVSQNAILLSSFIVAQTGGVEPVWTNLAKDSYIAQFVGVSAGAASHFVTASGTRTMSCNFVDGSYDRLATVLHLI